MRIENIFKSNFFSNSYIKNSLWAILGSFISKGLNFLSIAYVAKILGPDMFGEYNVIQTTIGLFGTVSGLGLGLAATKLIAEWRSRDLAKVGEMIGSLYHLSFIISGIVAIVFFVLSGWISANLLSNQNLKLLFQITSLIVVFDAINGVQNGILSGFESFKELTYINLVTGLVGAPVLVIGAYYQGLTGLTAALLFSRLLTVWFTRIRLKRIFNNNNIVVTGSIRKERLKAIFGISVPSFLSSMATSPVNWVVTTLVVNQPGGYSALGNYNAANQLRQLVLFLPDSAGKVSIPAMANAYGTNDTKKFNKTVILTFTWNLLLSLAPALCIYLFSSLFKDFIGEKYSIGSNLIFLVLITGVLIALTNAIGYIFICSDLIWYDFVLRVFWGGVLILLILMYGRGRGAYGYAASIAGAYLFHMVAQCIVLLFKLKIKRKP